MTQRLLENYNSSLPTVPYSNTGLLSSLPAPLDEHTGWPWTEETPPLPPTLPNGKQWPKISIVTPSYNQGQFIEETIRSVLLQNYPNLEYIIMDGGSTDNTVSILEKYTDWISLWRSEKDNGQTHAINKGFEYASGFIRGYLNSDDLLLPEALERVASLIISHLGQAILVFGDCEKGYSLGELFARWCPVPPASFMKAISTDGGLCPQPATFWTQPENLTTHRFNENIVFCMDHDFWCQLLKFGYEPIKLDTPLAFFREQPEAKSSRITDVMWSELAGLPLLKATAVESFEEKLAISAISRRRVRHYLRLEIEKIFLNQGKWSALQALISACWANPDLVTERPTLGLARKLLWEQA